MNLTEARDKLAAVLAPIADTDPPVLTSVVDSLEPPALMLGWGEPWLEPRTSCAFEANLTVWAVAARLMPGEGIATLEELVAHTLGRLGDQPGAWPLESVSGPRVFTIGGTAYIASQIKLKLNVNVTT